MTGEKWEPVLVKSPQDYIGMFKMKRNTLLLSDVFIFFWVVCPPQNLLPYLKSGKTQSPLHHWSLQERSLNSLEFFVIPMVCK